jgi:predicted acetyltransferase
MADEGFEFGLWLEQAPSWSAFVDELAAHRRGPVPPGRVPGTFLLAFVDGRLVGRSSIRYELNESLAREGGHIGYGVLREHRRQGYATEILRQSLVIARAEGVDRALLTCADDNVASIGVIERCGGVLDSVIDGSMHARTRRYWID